MKGPSLDLDAIPDLEYGSSVVSGLN